MSTVFIDILNLLSLVGENNIGIATYITATLSYLSLGIVSFIGFRNARFTDVPLSVRKLFKFWVLWMIFNIIRGAFIASSYWDWKFLLLQSVPFTLITLVFFIGNNIKFTKGIIIFYICYIFLFGFILIPLSFATNPELYSRIMIPVSIFMLFIPYLKKRWRWLVIFVTIVSVLIAIGFRAHLLKVLISLLLLLFFYFSKTFNSRIIKSAHLLLFIVPVFLTILGVFGSFNIWQVLNEWEGYKTETNRGTEISITNDSRTFLYVEVLGSMESTSDWLIGKSAAGKYDSLSFYDTGGARKGKRFRSEVNILNILLYHGIIGVILFLLLLYHVSYLAIYRSNNKLAKMLGLLIASRWLLSFAEEITKYDLNFYFFWLIMGLVSTNYFRSLTDFELQNFFSFNVQHSSPSHLS